MQILTAVYEQPNEAGTVLKARIKSRSYPGARFQYELGVGEGVAKVETERRLENADALLWVPSEGSMAFKDSRDNTARA